jgi:hypothetical protein
MPVDCAKSVVDIFINPAELIRYDAFLFASDEVEISLGYRR